MGASPLDRHGSTPAELQQRLQAERRGRPFLAYRDAAGAQVLFELAGRDAVTIGRRDGCDVALVWDSEVSRLHAELNRVGEDWVLRDEGLSHNGTFVNGERVHARRRLRDGDVIAAGATVLSFVAPSATAGSRTATRREERVVTVTPAQRRVLVELCRPLAAGRYDAPPGNRAIAEALCLSVETVKGTLRQLFELFEVADAAQNAKRAALATQALERGVVRREELTAGPPA